MLVAMDEIHRANEQVILEVENSNKEIAEIVSVINEISNKTKVINDIVFQTKLLSFNASVEAARAGEQGKGFAVVAEEVGNLARMSGNASTEINNLLSASIERVNRVINDSKTKVTAIVSSSKIKIDRGVEIANECGNVLDGILESAEHSKTSASEISEATSQQSSGISEINKAINELNSVTQQNASSAEEVFLAAKILDHESENLRTLVRELREGKRKAA